MLFDVSNTLRRNAVWNNLNRKARAQTSTGLLLSVYHQLRLYDPLVGDGCTCLAGARAHTSGSRIQPTVSTFMVMGVIGVRLMVW
jgi:hypothetical protein